MVEASRKTGRLGVQEVWVHREGVWDLHSTDLEGVLI